MRLSKDKAKHLFYMGIERWGVYGREAYVEKYPYCEHSYYQAHAAQAYLAGVKVGEFGHNRTEELRKVL